MTDRIISDEKIERYLSGEMPAGEREDFENLLKQDPALREELKLQGQLQEFLSDENGLKLRKMMEEKVRTKSRGKIIRLRRRMLVAAAAVITILLAGYFSWQGNKNLPDMYRKQFSPYLMVLSSRSGQDTDSVLRLAISSYQENRYQESAGYWSLLLNKDSSNTAARFYRGICELAQSQTQAARRDLSASGAGEASLFTEQANWYILLSFLQDNNKSEACRLLEKNRQQEYKAKEMQEIRNRICR